MLQLPILTLFFRLIPECTLYIFGNYVMTNKKIDQRKLFLSGILLGISIYLIRLLPIHFGVHTIIFLMLYIFVSVKINGMDFYKVVGSSMLWIIVLFSLEWMTVAICIKILGIADAGLFSDPMINLLCGSPSLIILFMVMMILYGIKNRNKRMVE